LFDFCPIPHLTLLLVNFDTISFKSPTLVKFFWNWNQNWQFLPTQVSTWATMVNTFTF
jgi:hypothetical protein